MNQKMMKLMRFLKIIVVGIGCLCGVSQISAQTIVHASIDSTMILIGEQTLVHLEVTSNQNQKLEWPWVADALTDGILVLEKSKQDTVLMDNNRLSIKQNYLITSFDSALYVIPPFRIVVDGADTLLSNSMVLKVITYPDIDPEEGINDIKPVISPEFVLGDYALYIWIVLGSLLVFCILMYILQKRKKKQPILSFKTTSKPKLPPHIEAISQLDKIKVEKLWQQGRNKEYYTQITDVLRVYVGERFHINAMEMTSDEILSEIYRLHDAHSAHETLKHVLELSDLVKFAKYVPLPNDNETSIMKAYLFVNQTKIEEIQPQVGANGKDANTDPLQEKPDNDVTQGNN